jgi:hypothetical protein
MTTYDNQTTNHPADFDDPLAAAEAGRLWRVEAIWPGESDWSVRLIVADAAARIPGGDLRLYNRGPKSNSPNRIVQMFAAGRWRSCEPVK